MPDDDKVEVCVIDGVEGWCVCINNQRVCGNKPWGGGKVLFTAHTTKKEIMESLKENAQGA